MLNFNGNNALWWQDSILNCYNICWESRTELAQSTELAQGTALSELIELCDSLHTPLFFFLFWVKDEKNETIQRL